MGVAVVRHPAPWATKEMVTMSTNSTAMFHVYAVDGFESAHKTAAAAIMAAKRGAARRGVLYTVVRCDAYGLTGGGHGVEIWASVGKPVAS